MHIHYVKEPRLAEGSGESAKTKKRVLMRRVRPLEFPLGEGERREKRGAEEPNIGGTSESLKDNERNIQGILTD